MDRRRPEEPSEHALTGEEVVQEEEHREEHEQHRSHHHDPVEGGEERVVGLEPAEEGDHRQAGPDTWIARTTKRWAAENFGWQVVRVRVGPRVGSSTSTWPGPTTRA